MFVHLIFIALIQDGSSTEQCGVNTQVLCSRMDLIRAQQTTMVLQMKTMRLQMDDMMMHINRIRPITQESDSTKLLHNLPEKYSVFKRIYNLQKRVHQLETRNHRLEQRFEWMVQDRNGIEEDSYLKKRTTESKEYFLKKPSSGGVIEGEDYEMDCQLNTPVSTCIWINPDVLNVYPQPEGKRYKLVGESLEDGGCSIRIMNVSMDHAGVWNCNPDIGNSDSPTATAQLTVQKRPDFVGNLLNKIEETNKVTETCQKSIQELNNTMSTIKELNQQVSDQCIEELKRLQELTEQDIGDLRNESQAMDDRLNHSINELQLGSVQKIMRIEGEVENATKLIEDTGDVLNMTIGQVNSTLTRRIKRESRFRNRQHLWYALNHLESKGYKCNNSEDDHKSWRCYRLYPQTLITHTAAATYCQRDGSALLRSDSQTVATLLSNITTTCDYEQQGLCYVWVDMEDFSCNEDAPCTVVNIRDHRKSCVDCKKCYGVICQADVRAVTARQWKRWYMELHQRRRKIKDSLTSSEENTAEGNEVSSLGIGS